MSGRLSPDSPSPPRSPYNKRQPLHVRPDSEVNEASLHISGVVDSEQEKTYSRAPLGGDKVYKISPFPTLESQILPPGDVGESSNSSASQIGSFRTGTLARHDARNTTTTPPVIIDNDSQSCSNETILNDAGSPVTPFHTHGISTPTPGLITPASTIRLVFEDDLLSQDERSQVGEESCSTQRPGQTMLERSSFPTNSPDWPLQSLSPHQGNPSTPTPASRVSRPTIRAIPTLNSDPTIRGTPGSAQSANSSGTQVHRPTRRINDNGDLPQGSYLNFANRQPRQTILGSEMPSSSPTAQRVGNSPIVDTSSPFQVADSFTITSSPDESERRGSFRHNSSGFPALRRYLEVAEATSRSSSCPSEQGSPTSESSPASMQDGRLSGNGGFRWNPLVSSSTYQTFSGGTTAPSSIRVISTEPSNLFDETETSRLTDATTQSSIRIVSADPSCVFDETETSALTENTNAQSSIRLVSPEASCLVGEEDVSALTFQTRSSIRVVEDSPNEAGHREVGDHLTIEETPTNTRSFISNGQHGIGIASSPVWVSYSSPAQLPHIADDSEPESESETMMPSKESPNLSQLSSSSSSSDVPTSPGAQEVIFPSNSSHVTRMPYRRKSIRQTSPFFHGSSGRSHLRQSTIGQSSEQDQMDFWEQDREEIQAATSSFVQNQLEPLPESGPISCISHTPESFRGISVGSSSYGRSGATGTLPFPAASSSVDSTPESIHIPRNRPLDRSTRIQHIRARTLGSTSINGDQNTGVVPVKSPRRSSSPVYPVDYPTPYTIRERPSRPSNPTPGVTPGATPAQTRRTRTSYLPTLLDINPRTEATPISYPSVVHRASHYQLSGRVGHRDFSPHLWHGAAQAINRRSLFRPPSVDEARIRFMAGAKTRRDVQVASFALGFLVPVCWIVASFLPLPNRGNVDFTPVSGSRWKGKAVIADPEKVGGHDSYSADEVAGFESARWWRGMNRCLSLLGFSLVAVLIVLGVVTSKGGIQR